MPKVLGRYHIISELGRGGMGVVYKAVDPKLERFIAIKCLSEELSNDEITVTRFLREARNVAALNHPHIAQIFLADEDEGKPYFVMEFIDGESLADRLARDQRLMPEQARRIVIECAEALKAAHEENIVHRDIKPGNIMIDRRGRTVLTDFGIAGIVHPDSQPRTSKYIMGTPGYLPPEVMTGRAADHRGDIFALGAVYYEMLAGKRLVPGSGIEDTARTLLAADFPELGDLDEQLDEASFGVLGRMLAPDPDKRYADYDALLADLRPAGAVVAEAVSADPVSEPTQVATPDSLPSASARPPQAATPPATEAIDSATIAPAPTQSSPPPAGRHRVRNASIVMVAVLGLAAVTLGALRLMPESMTESMPETFSQLTARWSNGAEDQTELTEDSRSGAPAEVSPGAPDPSVAATFAPATEPTALADQATPAAIGAGAGETDDIGESEGESAMSFAQVQEFGAGPADAAEPAGEPALSASAARVTEFESPPSVVDDESARQSEPAPVVAETRPTEQSVEPVASPSEPLHMARVAERATVARESRPATPERSAPAASPAPAEPSPAALATGVLVIGLGDPIFVDPMVREVEQALEASGHALIERGFVRGLSNLLAQSELDLSELSRAGVAAGAGKAVVVRAMPAGERELEYYGRRDTQFIVQVETVTYDLNRGRRLGASALAQTEYTVLNATSQARAAIAPRLALISEQIEP